MSEGRAIAIGFLIFFGVLFLTIFGVTGCTAVPAGHIGVVTNFGKVQDYTLKEGVDFLAPWKKVHKISVRTQELSESADVPTKEGLTVHLDATLLYSLDAEKARDVFQTIGAKYEDVLIKPIFRSSLRGSTVSHEAKDLYTASRAGIERELEKGVREELEKRGIRCERVLLRSVQLPPTVKNAIEAKLAADQQSQQMEFVLTKEKQEAERKRIEARGLADSQQIIKATLDDHYLRFLWIEALKNAKNQQATTIYIPTGNDGLPFFFDASPKKK